MVVLDAAQRLEARALCHDVLFPVRFVQLEHILQRSDGAYFCGEYVTIADVAVYGLASQILHDHGDWKTNGITPDVLSDCPKLRQQLVGCLDALPAVSEWNAQH